jgi:hypothetical protein
MGQICCWDETISGIYVSQWKAPVIMSVNCGEKFFRTSARENWLLNEYECQEFGEYGLPEVWNIQKNTIIHGYPLSLETGFWYPETEISSFFWAHRSRFHLLVFNKGQGAG